MGFDAWGVAAATRVDRADYYRWWLDHGYAATMEYLHRTRDETHRRDEVTSRRKVDNRLRAELQPAVAKPSRDRLPFTPRSGVKGGGAVGTASEE